MDKVILKRSTCHFIKGACRGLIYDSHLKEAFPIALELIDIIDQFHGKTKQQVFENLEASEIEIVDHLISQLLLDEIVFYTLPQLAQNFLPLSTSFETPQHINNCLIDFNPDFSYSKLIRLLDELLCQAIQIRSFHSTFHDKALNQLLSEIDESSIQSIDLVTKFSEHTTEGFIHEQSYKFQKLNTLLFFDAPFDKTERDQKNLLTLTYSTKKDMNSSHCGAVNPDYFSPDALHFFEAQKHNTCLNRKISIDVEGNIKNCPSMSRSFGKIHEIDLTEVISGIEFRKYWNISKDKIRKCKHCEFRYICTDCRAYIEDPHDIYSKPLKCGYDPYTGVWEEWSTNPLKETAIKHYGMEDLVKQRQERLKMNEKE